MSVFQMAMKVAAFQYQDMLRQLVDPGHSGCFDRKLRCGKAGNWKILQLVGMFFFVCFFLYFFAK